MLKKKNYQFKQLTKLFISFRILTYEHMLVIDAVVFISLIGFGGTFGGLFYAKLSLFLQLISFTIFYNTVF